MFDDQEWSQYLLGALSVLGNVYNWYEAGDMTPEQAAEAFRVIVQDAPYNLRTCQNPAGGKIFRVNGSGKVQELGDAGEWQDPTGDATIPPVPERTGGTPDDQKCLAAKNAANVLQLLYENVTDSFNDDLDEAEAATALTLTLVGLIGVEFAPITFALVTIFSIIFGVLYGLLEFVGADLWDENFTDSLVCILLGCASNDDGVVTFDYECFNNALAAQVTIVDLTFEQLRLFGQIQYLLLVIGGVDALNAAGATTAITDDDCPCGWCYQWLDGDGLGDWVTPVTLLGKNAGSYNSGDDSIDGTEINPQHNVWANALLTESLHIQRIDIYFDFVNTGGEGSDFSSRNIIVDGTVVQEIDYSGGSGTLSQDTWTADTDITSIGFVYTAQVSMKIRAIVLRGTGDPPTSGTPC